MLLQGCSDHGRGTWFRRQKAKERNGSSSLGSPSLLFHDDRELSSILGKLVLYVETTLAVQESHETQVMLFDLRILNFDINDK